MAGMSEEDEIKLREMWREYNERLAQLASLNEKRKLPDIGYGTLFDKPGDTQDWTLTMDIALPEGNEPQLLSQLIEMVEHAVKHWLMDCAPKGTRTSLLDVVKE